MTWWSNMLSGFAGTLVGGALSIVAAVMTIRHEQSQVREEASHVASSAITENMLTISNAMYAAQWALDPASQSSDSEKYSLLEKVHAASRSIPYKYNVVISDKTLRSRIDSLVTMVDTWYENAQKSALELNKTRMNAINSYIRRLNDSIRARLDGQPLPEDQPHPIS